MFTQVCSLKYEIGTHIGFSQKICNSLAESLYHGMYTTQFFLGNPYTYSRQKISDKDIQICNSILDEYPMNVFTHFPYIVNLSGSVKSLAWDDDKDVNRKMYIMLNGLEYELSTIAKIDSKKSGVVIHPGAFPVRSKGLDKIAETINKIKFSENSHLLLENCAGEGNKLCRDFTEIKQIFDQLKPEIKKHVGVCVDTAHIHGQGDYDLSSVNAVDKLFVDFDKLIGIENFSLLHLNDSMIKLGGKADKT